MRVRKDRYSGPGKTIAMGFLAVSIAATLASTADAQSPGESADRTISPSAPFKTVDDFQKAIGGPGVLYKSENVWMMAPAHKAPHAEIVLSYLAKGYDAMYDLVGVHSRHIMLVYALPKGHPKSSGGMSGDVIYFDDSNLDFDRHAEWMKHGMPHMYGYYQMMASSFVQRSGARFGGWALDWHLAAAATRIAANSRYMSERIAQDRRLLQTTYYDYRAAGNVVPRNLPDNRVYRIYAHLLWECEQVYGPDFWYDFYDYVWLKRKEFDERNWSEQDRSALRNERHELTVDCFDRLQGLQFRRRLREAGISRTVDLYTLQNTKSGWNRRLE